MKTFIAVFLASSLAFADPPADAPLVEHVCGTREKDLDAQGCAQHLKKGEPAPYEALALDEQEDVRRTRGSAFKTGTLNEAESKNVLIPKAAFAAIITGVIVITAGVTAGVVIASTKK